MPHRQWLAHLLSHSVSCLLIHSLTHSLTFVTEVSIASFCFHPHSHCNYFTLSVCSSSVCLVLLYVCLFICLCQSEIFTMITMTMMMMMFSARGGDPEPPEEHSTA